MKEYETKVLDIDREAVITKLRSLGAKEGPDVLLRRQVLRINEFEWIRVRDNGDSVKL